jgi:K+/H+ antiporter YhaU regulatory subunit KhtT
VNPPSNPDERFDQVESTLSQLANSQRHLLTAQVLMNDRMERAETAIQKLAEENVKLAEKTQVVAEKVDALIDIVQRWYERHGNGSTGQHPS